MNEINFNVEELALSELNNKFLQHPLQRFLS